MSYKKILSRITICFACLLVLLTFFAQTIQDLHVPRVSLTFAGQGTITADGNSMVARHVVPLSALRQDMTGYYILYVELEEHRFRSNYYVHAMRVNVDRRDMWNAAISGMWQQITDAPVVVNSDMPVHTGMRVRLTSVDDFTPAR